ncbi:MAG: enterochelin esterase [Coriobacteriales bacterium]|nr:enterochelin esterase [Coriobacteriales bacterium]
MRAPSPTRTTPVSPKTTPPQSNDEPTLSLIGPVKLVKLAPSDDTEAARYESSPESGRPTVRQKLREKVYGKKRSKKLQNTVLAPPKIPRPKLAPRVRTTAVTKTLRSQIRAIRVALRERARKAAGEGWPTDVYQQRLLLDATDPAEQKCLIDEAVESFWETTGAQTPIIYRDPQSHHHVFVTFLWRDSDARAVLLFVNRITDEKNLKDSLMKRLPHTDVWHITYRMERDWRASYCFIPSYDKKGLIDITGVHQASIRKALDRGIADPRNPVVCKNRADNALSVVELPDAPPQPWLAARPQLSCCGNVTSHRMHDGHSVWVYEPPETVRSADADNEGVPVLIMFDGDMWMRVERFHETLNNLIADGEIPPLYALLVETDDIAARWGELSEDSGVEGFVADELLSWARRRWPITDDASRIIVAGQSLGALSALWVAARRPESVGNVIAQSASLWRGSLMERADDGKASHLSGFTGRIYLECGKQEWVLLPLHRKFARMLKKGGQQQQLNYVEYNGGHDYACWRGGIADGLCWITKGWKE